MPRLERAVGELDRQGRGGSGLLGAAERTSGLVAHQREAASQDTAVAQASEDLPQGAEPRGPPVGCGRARAAEPGREGVKPAGRMPVLLGRGAKPGRKAGPPAGASAP